MASPYEARVVVHLKDVPARRRERVGGGRARLLDALARLSTDDVCEHFCLHSRKLLPERTLHPFGVSCQHALNRISTTHAPHTLRVITTTGPVVHRGRRVMHARLLRCAPRSMSSPPYSLEMPTTTGWLPTFRAHRVHARRGSCPPGCPPSVHTVVRTRPGGRAP